MIPLSGVRTSWLMLARNSLLALLADSAISLARIRSCWTCWRSVTSSKATATFRPGRAKAWMRKNPRMRWSA